MRVGIVGGGFAGLSAAIAFGQLGHEVVVFEKAPSPSVAGGAISLAPNALNCLSILGVRGHVATQPWSGLAATVRTCDGRILVRRTLAELTGGDEYATVPRALLMQWLTAALPSQCVRYLSRVTKMGVDGTITVGETTGRYDLVVGADGARGVARVSLWPHAAPLRSTGITGWAWIVDRELVTGFGPIWGRTADFGILPLSDGRTYIYGGSRIRTALSAFLDWPEPLPELIQAAAPGQLITPEIFEARPPRRLVTGKVVLIGDAAHTMRPTFGQGAALAMEDAIVLAYRGTAALARRWPRMVALYGMSKAGSYVAAPRGAALTGARNTALRWTPDPVFGRLAGAVSHWTPPSPSGCH